jgi:hypothetical protein
MWDYDTDRSILKKHGWLWIAISRANTQTNHWGSHFKAQKYDMIVSESFLRSLVRIYGKHTVLYTDR